MITPSSGHPRTQRRWRWGRWALAIGLMAPLVVALLAVSAKPSVVQGEVAAEVDAQAWVSFRHRLPQGSLMRLLQGERLTVQFSAAEVQVVAASVVRKFTGGSVDVNMGLDRAEVLVALPLARTPLGRLLPSHWLNVSTTWQASAGSRPELVQASVGQLPLPPALVWAAARQGAVWAGLPGAVDMAWQMVEGARLTPAAGTVQLHLNDELKRAGFALVVPREDWPALPEQRGVLVKALATRGCALSGVLQAMFERARQRTMGQALLGDGSRAGNAQDTAARENRVVLLVAAMHAVKWPVQRTLPGADQWIDQGTAELCLNGRVDFAQHFLLSALLSSQAGSRAASGIGLFKEVLDSTPGQNGSGFSFNDIAADLAGTRLGARARQEPVRLQFQATEAHRDTDWMPDVRDLPEFMTAEAVKQQYGGPGSPAFDRMWADIQQRVDRLPVLR